MFPKKKKTTGYLNIYFFNLKLSASYRKEDYFCLSLGFVYEEAKMHSSRNHNIDRTKLALI